MSPNKGNKGEKLAIKGLKYTYFGYTCMYQSLMVDDHFERPLFVKTGAFTQQKAAKHHIS